MHLISFVEPWVSSFPSSSFTFFSEPWWSRLYCFLHVIFYETWKVCLLPILQIGKLRLIPLLTMSESDVICWGTSKGHMSPKKKVTCSRPHTYTVAGLSLKLTVDAFIYTSWPLVLWRSGQRVQQFSNTCRKPLGSSLSPAHGTE